MPHVTTLCLAIVCQQYSLRSRNVCGFLLHNATLLLRRGVTGRIELMQKLICRHNANLVRAALLSIEPRRMMAPNLAVAQYAETHDMIVRTEPSDAEMADIAQCTDRTIR